jgi:hypothetical protein
MCAVSAYKSTSLSFMRNKCPRMYSVRGVRVCSNMHKFIRIFLCVRVLSLLRVLSLTHALTHAHTHILTHTRTHSLTHSLTHAHTLVCSTLELVWSTLHVRWSWYHTSKSMPKRLRTRKTSSLSRYLVFRTCNVKNQNDQERQKVNNHKLIWRQRCRTHFYNFPLNFIQSFFWVFFRKIFAFFVQCTSHTLRITHLHLFESCLDHLGF